mgnify:CR=1 FL=1
MDIPASNPSEASIAENPVDRLRRLQSERRKSTADVMSGILSAYFGTARDAELEGAIDDLIDAMLLAEGATEIGPAKRVGRLREGRALTVLGNPGAGKTRALERLFLTRQEFAGFGNRDSDCLLVSVSTPSPCTLRLLGEKILGALGYDVARPLRENVVWQLVRTHLQLRGVRFLHIDEVNHVLQSNNSVEITKVRDTLKDLMQNRDWPVWLILSGTREVASLLTNDDRLDDGDTQVWRRSKHVVFGELTLQRDAPIVRSVIKFYGGKKAQLDVNTLLFDEFCARLLHASLNEFGIVVEFVQDAIKNALDGQSSSLAIDHFAEAYRYRTGCEPGLNVFTAKEWTTIDPRRGLMIDPEDKPELKKTKAPRDVRNK